MRKTIIIIALLIISTLLIIGKSQAQYTKLVVSLTGSVIDEETRKPISTEMAAFDETGRQVYRGKSNGAEKGYYFITGLQAGQVYTIKFGDFEYFKQSFDVQIPNTNKYAEFSHDFLVKPKRKGVRFTVSPSPFEFGKTRLRYGADVVLEEIRNVIKTNPRMKFEIVSYPDDNKDNNLNKKITEDRCKALVEHFVSNGIKSDRISIKPEAVIDPQNPLPTRKTAKGKRYIGSTYLVVTDS
jgi:outer membrane protein OmpA-like peptidoglycan-associated protein